MNDDWAKKRIAELELEQAQLKAAYAAMEEAVANLREWQREEGRADTAGKGKSNRRGK